MKSIINFIFVIILTLVFTACDQFDNNNEKDSPISTKLRLSNHSSYDLFNVRYTEVNFGDIALGSNRTMDVSANTHEPVYFELSINNNRIQCRTNDMVNCSEGSTEERVINNTAFITVIASGRTGTLAGIFETLSKPIFELSQDGVIIDNNAPLPFDFGIVELGTNRQLVFTIKNAGNLPLELTGEPVILSSNTAFTIPSQPTNTTVSPDASAAFMLQYTPTAEREDTATISIFNNSDELVFILNVKGAGYVKKPEIIVRQGTSAINPNGEYNFGNVTIGEQREVIFTIGNSGEAPLNIIPVNDNRVNIEDNSVNHYSIIQPGTAVLAPGGTTTFTVRFTPISAGNSLTALISIMSNSENNDEYLFTVRGNSTLSIPTGVTAVSQGTDSIKITWNPVPGATSYYVFSGSSDWNITQLVGNSVTETTFTHTGLSAGTRYYYNISAQDGAIQSVRSQNVNEITVPGIPANLRSTNIGHNSIALAWNSTTGASGYRIYFATSEDGNKIQIFNSSGTSFTHNNLSPSTNYYYFIAAVNASGEGSLSQALEVKTLMAPLSPPGNVKATALSTSSIQITWDPVPDAIGYRLYRRQTAAGTRSLIGTVTTTSFTNEGLTARTFWYDVTALNIDNVESPLSATISMIPMPNIPTNVSANGTPNGVRINWSEVSGADNYRIYFASSLTGTRNLAGTSTSVWNGYTHSGTANTIYFYWVTAVNTAGESDFSLHSSGVMPPAAPANLRQTGSTTSSFTVAWDAVPGATRYDIFYYGYIRLSSTTYSHGWHSSSQTGTSITIGNCFSNDYFQVYVQAYNGNTGLSGPETNRITATTR